MGLATKLCLYKKYLCEKHLRPTKLFIDKREMGKHLVLHVIKEDYWFNNS